MILTEKAQKHSKISGEPPRLPQRPFAFKTLNDLM